ncbi:hypothetical protein EJ06DRAFT_500759 [Trichodelitschia bisporula]|uniref:CSN8/PSMD8/EIF3K domain-containing protein n=1 Tax=Trichodelitschia bisporula TaxID=703511 RepID=A0A6G1HK23_9PEZI|nr:hypothetical protein EJ06DRAFT_500759 [Trichodelitschia bisporula]
MSNPRPSAGRRGPSGAWSRLKAAPSDPLLAYGLPSKGETRLNDPKLQENFYNKIVERYMKFCAASGGGDELDRQFAALTLSPSSLLPPPQQPTPTDFVPRLDATPAPLPNPPPSPELQTILAAMRKLREAIRATKRTDAFAQRAYVFLIRAAILARAWEAYAPALLYLLQGIHPRTPLSGPELREFAVYYLLDLACRQGDLGKAYAIRMRYGLGEGRVDGVLRALVSDDWVLFWRMRKRVDGYQRCLMGWAEEGVRLHALKCLGRTYFSAEKGFIEKMVERDWGALVTSGVGWELQDDGVVVIRRVRAR